MAAKWESIASDLRSQIESGALAKEQRLPSEASLARQYGVTVTTLRRAVDTLVADGLITRRHGLGTYIAQRRPRLVRDAASRYQWEQDRVLLSKSERLAEGSTERDSSLTRDELDFEATYSLVAADEDLAHVFGVSPGTSLLQRVYLTRPRGDTPFGRVVSHLVHKDAARNPDLLDEANEPWPGGTQHQLWTIGLSLGEIEDRVTARVASAQEVENFGIAPGSAIINIRKISRAQGRVVEVADTSAPADRLELVYTIPLKGIQK